MSQYSVLDWKHYRTDKSSAFSVFALLFSFDGWGRWMKVVCWKLAVAGWNEFQELTDGRPTRVSFEVVLHKCVCLYLWLKKKASEHHQSHTVRVADLFDNRQRFCLPRTKFIKVAETSAWIFLLRAYRTLLRLLNSHKPAKFNYTVKKLTNIN